MALCFVVLAVTIHKIPYDGHSTQEEMKKRKLWVDFGQAQTR